MLYDEPMHGGGKRTIIVSLSDMPIIIDKDDEAKILIVARVMAILRLYAIMSR